MRWCVVCVRAGNVSERHMASVTAGRTHAEQAAMCVWRVETCVLQGERVCA